MILVGFVAACALQDAIAVPTLKLNGSVNELCFSADGSQLAARSATEWCVWDVRNRRELVRQQSRVTSLAFSRSGLILAEQGRGIRAKLLQWDREYKTSIELGAVPAPCALGYCASSNALVWCGPNTPFWVRPLDSEKSGAEVRPDGFELTTGANLIIPTPDGRSAFVVGSLAQSTTGFFLDLATGKVVGNTFYFGLTGRPAAAISSDGKYLVRCTPLSVLLSEVRAPSRVRKLNLPDQGPVQGVVPTAAILPYSVAFSADSKMIYVGDLKGKVLCIDVRRNALDHRVKVPENFKNTVVATGHDGQLAVGSESGEVVIVNEIAR